MRLLTFLVGIVLPTFPTIAMAQTWQVFQPYSLEYTLSPQPISYTNSVDNQGCVFVSGYASGNVDFAGLIYGNSRIQKLSPQGEVIWEKEIEGKNRLTLMNTSMAGKVALAGTFVHTIALDGESLSHSQDANFPVILQLSEQGDLEWMYDLSTFNVDFVECQALTVGSDNSIWVAGHNFVDSYIIHFSEEGEVLEIVVQSNVNEITSIDVDNQGNLYVAGACAQEDAIFKQQPASATFSFNSYIAKYNSVGDFVWVKFQEESSCTGPIVKVENPDFVYITNHLSSARSFGDFSVPGPQTIYAPDFYLACLNSEGEYQWVRDAPGNGKIEIGNRACLATDADNNIFLAGRIQGATYWENNITTFSLGSNDAIVMKFDSEGQLLLARTAGGAFEERADAVSVTTSGAIWLSGIASGNITLDTINHTSSPGISYAFAAKLASEDIIEEEVLDVENIANVSWKFYPNPANDILMIEGNNEESRVQLWSIEGKLIRELSLRGAQMVNVSDLQNGIYTIRLIDDNTEIAYSKLVIQHR
jgi:hypothetical protein